MAESLKTFSMPSYEESDSIEQMATDLHKRIHEETWRIIKAQCVNIGIDEKDIANKVTKVYHKENDRKLCTYLFEDKIILQVSIAPNWLSVEFSYPNMKETKGGPNDQC